MAVPLHSGQSVTAVQLWYGYLLLLLVVLLLLGKAITGSWRGVLIDERNVISLSRFQLLAWTWLILPAYAVAVLWNLQQSGTQAIDSIALDSSLWLLMGISTTSLAASPLILNGKKTLTPASIELQRTFAQLQQQGDLTSSHQGLVVTNQSLQQAKWSDMLTGEETGNAAHLDVSRLQMFFFTLISLLIYAATLNAMFARFKQCAFVHADGTTAVIRRIISANWHQSRRLFGAQSATGQSACASKYQLTEPGAVLFLQRLQLDPFHRPLLLHGDV